MFEVNNPELTSWVDVPDISDFPIQNLPFGIFSTAGQAPRPGVAIGEHIVDLNAVSALGLLDGLGCERSDFAQTTLNAFIARGKAVTRAVRERLSALLRTGGIVWVSVLFEVDWKWQHDLIIELHVIPENQKCLAMRRSNFVHKL